MSVAFKYREIAVDDQPPSIPSDESTADRVVSHARFDICPTWLELATRYLSDARAAQATRVTGWSRSDEIARADALEWEFEASVQAIVASGIAMEAFSAAVQSKVQLPQSLRDQWRDNSTPRYIQIAEVLRRALSLSSKGASGVRQCVGEILRFHDLAIDPSHKSGAHVFHPELRAGVEWRFAYFRYENALLIVQATLRLLSELIAHGKANDAEVQQYVDALRPKLEPMLYLLH
jgi:hypothetical protein